MNVESLLSDWDGETVIFCHDKPAGAWIFVAIHSTRLGLAGGGTRMKAYPDQPSAILNATTIPQLKCRVVAGGANNQLGVPEDAEGLRVRGILYAPDYAINAGGAMALLGIETMGWSYQQAEREVVAGIQRALRQIFATAQAEGITTEAAARRIAEDRLRAGA